MATETETETVDEPAGAAPCANCEAVIDSDIEECPECGNNPIRFTRRVLIFVTGAGLLTAPFMVGIPFVIFGVFGYVATYFVDYSPTEYEFGA